MKSVRQIFYGLLVLLAVFVIGLLSRPFFFPTEPLKSQRDTTYLRDTIRLPAPKPKTIIEYKDKPIYVDNFDTLRLRDTIYLTLPTHQKYYKDERYEAWVSGYKPNLDSINIFTKDKIITNTIYKEEWNWYLETGVNSIDSKIAPYVGIRLTMPNNFGIGGNIGVFDNKAFYGFSINYKIKW